MNARAAALLSVLAATFTSSGCKHREELAINSPPQQFFARGRALFYGKELVGEGGQTCTSCHEKAQPFEGHQLARRIYDLPSSIAHCLLTRTKYQTDDKTPEDVRALAAYVIHKYVHDGIVLDEDEEGIRRLGEAMNAFLAGEYDIALREVRGAHGLIKTRHYHVRALVLEGCIHVFRLSPEDAKIAFAEAVRLDPHVKIDGNFFSPKVSEVLEQTRLEVAAAAH